MLHRRAAFLAAGSAAISASVRQAKAAPAALPQTTDPSEVGFAPNRLERIDAWFKAEVDANRIPGAVVAIGKGGKLAYLNSFGYRDRESQAPMPKNAVFRIASMTKPFASLALMLLVEEGKCALWHPVARYLAEFGKPVVGMDRVPAQREIRVQDLLRHTSGLTYGALPVQGGPGADPVQKAYADAKVSDPDQTSAEFITKLAAQPLLYQPGTHWEYSHSTDVVGRLVEVISGKDLNAFIQERVCKPLGLADTGFWAPQSSADRIALPQVDPATGRKQAIPNPLQQPKWYSGGGGMVSTAGDYARFCQMLLNGGELDGALIASRKTIDLMASDHLPPGVQYGPGLFALFGGLPPSPEVSYGFGLGFAVRTMSGRSPVPGSVGDYFWAGAYGTYFWVDPAEELYVVMMLQGPSDRLQYRYAMRSLVYGALA
jgi:CubicO group peptidase (beta-lactamase class C family)